jgi:hypothetical protein
MLRIIGAAILLSSLVAASAHPVAPQDDRVAAPVRTPVRVAQSSCWYVVLYCKTRKADVDSWSQMNGGEVINTSSDEFPGFTRGYHCAVVGPLKSRGAAQSEAATWRAGAAPDAYVKDSGSGC